MKPVVFSVEDDENIRELLEFSLSNFGFEVTVFNDAEAMMAEMQKRTPHLILLDIMLPKMSGTDAIRIIRANDRFEKIPVIFLTAKESEASKVTGLNLGADDYVVKPFSILELVARMNAHLRRSKKENDEKTSLSVGTIRMDLETRQVFKDGHEIKLTLKEFNLFRKLVENHGKVVLREDILTDVWGYDFLGETRTLDMHIRSLREKIGDDGKNPKIIITIRGIGYACAREEK